MTAATAAPIVHAAFHTRIEPPLAGRDASPARRLRWLADEAGAQMARLRADVPAPRWLPFVCTTCMSPMLTGRPGDCDALDRRLEAIGGLRPIGWLQAYECAGWGYALRFAGLHGATRHVAISIIDADLHDVFAGAYEKAIGAVGYGVTTLAVELPERAALPECGGPHPNRGFTEFLHSIRAGQRAFGRRMTFLPFLPEAFASVAERLIGRELLAANRHAAYGHTFGADPWIGLIEWFDALRPASAQTVTAGAFAYDGYFTRCDFVVPPTLKTALRVQRSDVAPGIGGVGDCA
ncbi:MAG: hypothetical protein ABW032_07720 [Burkholderiaceae bacterium]